MKIKKSMQIVISVGVGIMLSSVAYGEKMELIKDKKPKCVIVRGNDSEICSMATKTLQRAIQKSSQVKLEIFPVSKVSSIPKGMNRIFVGDCSYSRKKGLVVQNMLPEEYVVKADGRDLFLLGRNKISKDTVTGAPGGKHPEMDYRQVSPATLWAVNDLLDRVVGVRYLWPGEEGIYVPQKATIVVNGDLSLKERPPLERRQLWFSGRNSKFILDEANTYMMNHQQGSRIKTNFVHAFDHWWEKYSKKYPEIFAKSSTGKRTYQGLPVLAKFCISNPLVEKLMMQEWRDEGRPDLGNIGPNDGLGFCTCEKCRALDGPEGRKYSAKQIWMGHKGANGGSDLARRNVVFWNKIMRKMKKENPQVRLCSFGYGSYKNFPENMKLEDGFLIAVVPPDFNADGKKIWKGWQRSGAELFLRPNWWHTLWLAPYLPLKKAGAYFNMAKKNKMIGYEFDTIIGTWGTQAPYYYLIARMSYRPDLSVQQIKEEFASAFGKGAPDILKYLDYWEAFTYKVGGAVAEEENQKMVGLYTQAYIDHNLRKSPLYGTWETLPYIYTDEVVRPAEKILDDAEKKIDPTNKGALYKLNFLRDGLKHLKATRDCVASFNKRPMGRTQENRDRYSQLLKLRKKLNKNHVIWENVINRWEKERRIRIIPKGEKKGAEK